MDQFIFLKPGALFLLWMPVLVLASGIVAILKSRTLLKDLFKIKRPSKLGQFNISVFLLFILGLTLLTFSLSRPSWGSKENKVTKMGRDVVFVIDVSRSMLAEDIAPNRLERAKIAILDTLRVLDGDRVALVAFAGNSVIKSPLTLDYNFFREAVYNLSPDSVARGGSMIGDALRKTIDGVFQNGDDGYKDIILITDGEDQESYPIKAAETLSKENIRLIAIGLGDENIGKRIPITNSQGQKVFLSYNNQEIWSRLDAETLREMVSKTRGGNYLNVSTGTFDLGEIYRTLIKTQEKKFLEEETTILREERFQYFILPGIILLIASLILEQIQFGGRKKK